MTGETPAVHEALAVYAPEAPETERVPPGYRPSEVGVIPEDWTIARLDELAELTSSRRIFEHEYVTSGVPFFRGKEISLLVNGEPIADPYFISEKRYNELESQYGAPAKGDILITAVGTLGNIYVVPGDIRFYFKDGNLIWLRKIEVAESDYVAAQLKRARTKIIGGSIGSSQRALTIVVLKDVQIPVPPLLEQRAIAAALSDVDALISALYKLISKKRAVKTAAMQQLLTGQQRLPGFNGEWEMRRLGDIAPLQRGFDLPNSMLKKGGYPVVYSNGILNHHTDFMVEGPGVVTGRSGTIGKVSYVEEDYWPHNTALWVTDFKGNSPKFIYHLYKSIGLDRFGTGSGVPTLNRNDVHAFSVSVPSSEEQTAIAAVLSDMDAEIEALEARREKTRRIKQGMMQELLTGRTRLV